MKPGDFLNLSISLFSVLLMRAVQMWKQLHDVEVPKMYRRGLQLINFTAYSTDRESLLCCLLHSACHKDVNLTKTQFYMEGVSLLHCALYRFTMSICVLPC
jgi:hypothetical protein